MLDHPGIVKVLRATKQRLHRDGVGRKESCCANCCVSRQSFLLSALFANCAADLRCARLPSQHGIVHRDLNRKHHARWRGQHQAARLRHRRQGRRTALTFGKLSTTMGTPDYISPEQVQCKRGDCRSDIYAVGVMLYEMTDRAGSFSG